MRGLARRPYVVLVSGRDLCKHDLQLNPETGSGCACRRTRHKR